MWGHLCLGEEVFVFDAIFVNFTAKICLWQIVSRETFMRTFTTSTMWVVFILSCPEMTNTPPIGWWRIKRKLVLWWLLRKVWNPSSHHPWPQTFLEKYKIYDDVRSGNSKGTRDFSSALHWKKENSSSCNVSCFVKIQINNNFLLLIQPTIHIYISRM